jgi:hypothetical protein
VSGLSVKLVISQCTCESRHTLNSMNDASTYLPRVHEAERPSAVPRRYVAVCGGMWRESVVLCWWLCWWCGVMFGLWRLWRLLGGCERGRGGGRGGVTSQLDRGKGMMSEGNTVSLDHSSTLEIHPMTVCVCMESVRVSPPPDSKNSPIGLSTLGLSPKHACPHYAYPPSAYLHVGPYIRRLRHAG